MSEGTDSRFAHLLQPIKDLTKNWDVDIASSLEDYIEELVGTAISFDDGVTTMNFAEAAMLIQSSACVYSKKVEYLYSLFQEMLDLLANKKKLAKKKQDGDNNDETAAEFADNDEEFLTLDDIEEGHDIDMKGDFDNDEPFHFLPQIPLSLIPKEEADLGGNPLLSETGEVLASRNDFMMNTCSVDGPTGALLLDLSHLTLLQELPHPPAAIQETLQNDPIVEATAEARVSEVSEDPELPHVPEDAPDDGDEEMPPLDITMQEQQPMDGPADTAPDNTSDVSLRRSERRKQKEVAAAPKQAFDPWKPLDMYDELDTPKQPPKKGVIFKLPPGLKDKTRKRKRPNTKAAPALEPLNVYISKAFYSNVKKYPKNPLKVPTDSYCDTLFWKEFKRRKEILRKESEKKRHHSIIISEAAEEEEEREEEDNWDIHGDAEIDEDDDLQPLVDDNLMNAINEGLRSNEEFVRGMPDRDLADRVENSVIMHNYEDMVRQHVEQYMAAALSSVQTTELSCRVAEWQDKVVPSLKEEETREPFDINTYGNRVIGRLEHGRCVDFEHVVSGKPGFEVCRTFLAMLMLANTHNVEIKSTSEGLAVNGTNFGVQLLSKKRHFEELQEFQAPSINSNAEKS